MYERISAFSSLLASYYRARENKRYKDTILRFGFYLESNLFKLQQELINETYSASAYSCFTVHDPKERTVTAPAFRDRVMQHSLIAEIEPVFERFFIYDSYACRREKGTHFALMRFKKFLASARSIHGPHVPLYCLRMDISKYFASMLWDVLLPLVFKRIPCVRTHRLIEKIITQYQFFDHKKGVTFTPSDRVLSPKERRGLPIGNLTSQLFANIYLNELDHYVKDTLRIRWYGRYMDDFLILHHDKHYLTQIKEDVRDFLAQHLKLSLSDKKVIISNVKNGVPFVGYRIFYDHVLVRGNTLRHMQRKLKQRREEYKKGNLSSASLRSSTYSIHGHLKYANSWGLKKTMFHKKI